MRPWRRCHIRRAALGWEAMCRSVTLDKIKRSPGHAPVRSPTKKRTRRPRWSATRQKNAPGARVRPQPCNNAPRTPATVCKSAATADRAAARLRAARNATSRPPRAFANVRRALPAPRNRLRTRRNGLRPPRNRLRTRRNGLRPPRNRCEPDATRCHRPADGHKRATSAAAPARTATRPQRRFRPFRKPSRPPGRGLRASCARPQGGGVPGTPPRSPPQGPWPPCGRSPYGREPAAQAVSDPANAPSPRPALPPRA
jgi:hypothetical protein